MNPTELKEDFIHNGFVLIKDLISKEVISKLVQDISAVANACFGSIPAPFDLKHYQPKGLVNRGAFYDFLRYVPNLNVLSGSQTLVHLSHVLGLAAPVVMKVSNIRMDLPYEDRFLFHWHQDITYLLGAINSVTYWIPLTPVNKLNGTIEVIPRTHNRGVLPFRCVRSKAPQKYEIMSPNDIFLQDDPKETGVFIDAEPGDVVAFSQLLLHRSTLNRSNLSRWVVQVRHTNIDSDFIKAGCPLGDRSNIYFYPNYYGAHQFVNAMSKPL